MSNPNIYSEVTTMQPSWRRVPGLADLVEIFDPGVQVCAWQREIDPAIEIYLSGLPQTGQLHVMETLSPGRLPRLDSLPVGSGREALIADLSLLHEIVYDLVGDCEVGLRLARVAKAMCPAWHVDRVGIRLVCTYQGTGMQWLDDQDVDRVDLHSDQINKGDFIQATTGEIVLLKGTQWPNNNSYGAVHRSPEIGPNTTLRTLISLDPLVCTSFQYRD